MNCALFGISGLVGSATAPLLVGLFDSVIAPVRRPYGNSIAGIHTPLINFEQMGTTNAALLQRVDCVVYCLGTTLKVAKSVSEFRRIEWNLATDIAGLARRSRVRRFVLLSAAATSADSLVPYSRVKGEIERMVTQLGLPELVIAKPSLLVGDRAETRIIEGLSLKLTRPLLKPLQRWIPKVAPIQDIQVARALAQAAIMPLRKPVTILGNADLLALAGPPIRNVISLR